MRIKTVNINKIILGSEFLRANKMKVKFQRFKRSLIRVIYLNFSTKNKNKMVFTNTTTMCYFCYQFLITQLEYTSVYIQYHTNNKYQNTEAKQTKI